MNNKIIVGLVITFSIIALAIGTFWYQDQQQKEQVKTIESGKAKLVRNHSPAIGSPLFRVILVKFLGPECESFRVFHPIVKEILKKYEDQIHYVVRYAPFHKHSKETVAFLEVARM